MSLPWHELIFLLPRIAPMPPPVHCLWRAMRAVSSSGPGRCVSTGLRWIHYTIGSCCKTWSMGLPTGPRGIEEHTYSVAIFSFTTTITGGIEQSTTASKQTRKSAFPHHPQQVQKMEYGLTKSGNGGTTSRGNRGRRMQAGVLGSKNVEQGDQGQDRYV